jgi:hypothetical protein
MNPRMAPPFQQLLRALDQSLRWQRTPPCCHWRWVRDLPFWAGIVAAAQEDARFAEAWTHRKEQLGL